MNEAVTFNAIGSNLQVTCIRCVPKSSASARSTNYRIKINPNAKTVEIFNSGFSKAFFSNIDFTNGDTTFAFSTSFPSITERQNLKIVLPGSLASNLDYASYGVWGHRIDSLFFTTFYGEALSFGVLTTANHMPTAGTATYNGFMDGYYANVLNEVWDLTGSVNLIAKFATAEITGEVNNISATRIIGPPGFFNFGNIAINGAIAGDTFSGTASSSGLSGVTFGQFYGPNADEVGGVFQMSNGRGAEAVGAFAAGQ